MLRVFTEVTSPLCVPVFQESKSYSIYFFSMRDSVRIHWTTEVTATRYFEPPKKRKLLAARRWLREPSMPRRGSQLSVCFKLKGEGVSFLQVVCFPLERADFKWMKPKHFVLPHCFWWVIFFFFRTDFKSIWDLELLSNGIDSILFLRHFYIWHLNHLSYHFCFIHTCIQ